MWAQMGLSKMIADPGPWTRRALQRLRPIGNSTPRGLAHSPAESPAVSSCAATEAVAAASELDAARPPVERLETMARELIIGLEGPSLETLCRGGDGRLLMRWFGGSTQGPKTLRTSPGRCVA